MDDATPPTHRRKEQRIRRSTAVFWRCGEDPTIHMGWLLESSRSGLAFANRGDPPPAPDTRIHILRDPSATPATWEHAVIRHSHTAHADLSVIAVQFLSPELPPNISLAELKIWNAQPTRTYSDLNPLTHAASRSA